MNFKLKENQTKNHFIWEVYSKGYKTGLLTKEQAGDICAKELGLDFDESAFRKKYEAFEAMWSEVKQEYLLDTDEELIERLAKIEEKEDELYKAKVKTADKLRQHRQLLRDDSRLENIIDEIKSEISYIEPIIFKHNDLKKSNKEAINLIGDWHIGAKVDNFFGKYDMKISKDRVEKMCTDVLSYVDKFEIETLHVVNLGDMIENGAIHISARVMQEEDAIRQIMYVSELLSTYLTKLSESCEVQYYSTLDNHSRSNPKFTDNIAKESFVYLIDWYLEERLKNNKRVNFNKNMIDDSIGYFEAEGRKIMFTHGNFGKMNTSIQDLALGTGIIPDYVCMGHFHVPKMKDFHGRKLLVNGCLSGVSQYALDNRMFGKPAQTMLVFDGENEINLQIKF